MARNTACFCVYYWLREATVSNSGRFFFRLLVKAFGNGNGIDGTEMELLTAPRISSAMSRCPCPLCSLCCWLSQSQSQFVSQWLAKVLRRPFQREWAGWRGDGGSCCRKCHLIPYRRDSKSVDAAQQQQLKNKTQIDALKGGEEWEGGRGGRGK